MFQKFRVKQLGQWVIMGFSSAQLGIGTSAHQGRGGAAGRTGLMVRASDSGSGDPGSILGRVGVFVSLSKRHLLPKKYW